jgi:hypothetical protein
MRQRYCRMCGNWHDLEAWPVECFRVAAVGASDTIPVPYFISDTMEPTLHPLDQRHYTSKSTFERITREGGYETVGDDPARLRPAPKPKADKQAIKNSVQKAVARFRNGERVQLP